MDAAQPELLWSEDSLDRGVRLIEFSVVMVVAEREGASINRSLRRPSPRNYRPR